MRRLLYKMKYQTLRYAPLVLVILALGGIWLFYALQDPEPMPVLPATINQDCAPWDGSAFTVSIPSSERTIINVSIWQSPDIKLPATFSFPDETGQIGFAYILTEPDHIQELVGEVSFSRVEEEIPV